MRLLLILLVLSFSVYADEHQVVIDAEFVNGAKYHSESKDKNYTFINYKLCKAKLPLLMKAFTSHAPLTAKYKKFSLECKPVN